MISIDDVVARQRSVLDAAVPIDRRIHMDRWVASDFASVTRQQMLRDFWGAEVPGSGAYDEMLTGAVVAAHQLGWNTRAACDEISRGWHRLSDGETDLGWLSGQAELVFSALEGGRPIVSTVGSRSAHDEPSTYPLLPNVADRTLASWQGKIAGGAFGTALEGCRGAAISSVYGSVRSYVAPPTTLNDDVVYELVALDVLGRVGFDATVEQYASTWAARIPFGWSAEWVALDNLSNGVGARQAAVVRNPMNEWIGAQMRGMVFGQLCPGDPWHGARLARVDASLSHRGAGVEGAAFAAMLCALSFSDDDVRRVVRRAITALAPSLYRTEVVHMLERCETGDAFDESWTHILARYPNHNWIHCLPNIGAVLCALWFGENDMTTSFALLARAGLDVDCNAGLVGAVLGACNGGVPSNWIKPLDNRIDTYLPDLPTVPISTAAEITLNVSASLRKQ